MKGRSIKYEAEELAWIEARRDWVRSDLHSAFCAFWKRDDISLTNLKALCKRKGWIAPLHRRGKRDAKPNKQRA